MEGSEHWRGLSHWTRASSLYAMDGGEAAAAAAAAAAADRVSGCHSRGHHCRHCLHPPPAALATASPPFATPLCAGAAANAASPLSAAPAAIVAPAFAAAVIDRP